MQKTDIAATSIFFYDKYRFQADKKAKRLVTTVGGKQQRRGSCNFCLSLLKTSRSSLSKKLAFKNYLQLIIVSIQVFIVNNTCNLLLQHEHSIQQCKHLYLPHTPDGVPKGLFWLLCLPASGFKDGQKKNKKQTKKQCN